MLPRLFEYAMLRIMHQSGPPPTIIAAFSGGMDSAVLLHLLAGFRDTLPSATNIIAAHMNHGLRGADADGDLEFCRLFARNLGIDFAERTVDVARIARDERMGVEEAGRVLRYRFFHDIGCPESLVLTGHHADDQAETILLNLRRGAHRRGLSGMREYAVIPVPPGIKVRIGRPLLTCGREALHTYALENGLDWREDATNNDSSFARNRIRHRIIPALENLMPGFRVRLLEKADVIAHEEEALTERGRGLAEEYSRHEHGGRFLKLGGTVMDEPEAFTYALRHIVEEEMGGRLPYGAVLSRLAELAEAGRLGETLSLPARLKVRKEQDGLFFFFPDREADDPAEEFILPDPPFDIQANGLTITATILPTGGLPPPEDMADSEVEWFNPAAVRWPLRIRPPRPGERFRPLGAPGSRKIQDILVDEKTPRRKRGMSRVVADHAGAVWLWPFRIANRVRLVGETSKAVRIQIRENGTIRV